MFTICSVQLLQCLLFSLLSLGFHKITFQRLVHPIVLGCLGFLFVSTLDIYWPLCITLQQPLEVYCKTLIVKSVYERRSSVINPLNATSHFLYPLKNLLRPLFRGYRKWQIACNRLKTHCKFAINLSVRDYCYCHFHYLTRYVFEIMMVTIKE